MCLCVCVCESLNSGFSFVNEYHTIKILPSFSDSFDKLYFLRNFSFTQIVKFTDARVLILSFFISFHGCIIFSRLQNLWCNSLFISDISNLCFLFFFLDQPQGYSNILNVFKELTFGFDDCLSYTFALNCFQINLINFYSSLYYFFLSTFFRFCLL